MIFHITCKAFDSANAGYGAVFFFVVNYIVYKNSQACMLESLLTLLVLLSLLFTYKYIKDHDKKYLLLVGLFSGLAVLTKGFAGLFAFGFIILYLLVTELKTRKFKLVADLILASVVFLISFSWWYAYAFLNTNLYQQLIVNESLERL